MTQLNLNLKSFYIDEIKQKTVWDSDGEGVYSDQHIWATLRSFECPDLFIEVEKMPFDFVGACSATVFSDTDENFYKELSDDEQYVICDIIFEYQKEEYLNSY